MVVEEIKAHGGQATLIKLDETDEDQAVAAVEHTTKTLGEITPLLNNADVSKPLFFLNINEPNYNVVMGANA